MTLRRAEVCTQLDRLAAVNRETRVPPGEHEWEGIYVDPYADRRYPARSGKPAARHPLTPSMRSVARRKPSA